MSQRMRKKRIQKFWILFMSAIATIALVGLAAAHANATGNTHGGDDHGQECKDDSGHHGDDDSSDDGHDDSSDHTSSANVSTQNVTQSGDDSGDDHSNGDDGTHEGNDDGHDDGNDDGGEHNCPPPDTTPDTTPAQTDFGVSGSIYLNCTVTGYTGGSITVAQNHPNTSILIDLNGPTLTIPAGAAGTTNIPDAVFAQISVFTDWAWVVGSANGGFSPAEIPASAESCAPAKVHGTAPVVTHSMDCSVENGAATYPFSFKVLGSHGVITLDGNAVTLDANQMVGGTGADVKHTLDVVWTDGDFGEVHLTDTVGPTGKVCAKADTSTPVVPAPVVTPTPTPASTPTVVDVCSNLAGAQASVPAGYKQVGTKCLVLSTD